MECRIGRAQRALGALLTVTLAPAGLGAEPSHDWSVVEKLAPGTRVVVTLESGSRREGAFARADAAQLVVVDVEAMDLPRANEAFVLRTLARDGNPIVEDDGVRLELSPFIHALPRAQVAAVRVPDDGGLGALGIVGGALGGALAAGYAGAALENMFAPCHCDYPGMAGGLIGIPIGLVGGAVVGHGLATRHTGVVYEQVAEPLPAQGLRAPRPAW